MQDAGCKQIIGLILAASADSRFDEDDIGMAVAKYCERSGESFRGIVTVTETCHGMDLRYSVEFGNPNCSETSITSNAISILPSGEKITITVESHPLLCEKEVLDAFIDQDGHFAGCVVLDGWQYDIYCQEEKYYAVYSCLSPRLRTCVDLVIDNGEIWVRESDSACDEVRIRSRKELVEFMAEMSG